MIHDCFPFFREFDVLEMRLTLLDGVVDRFVLCEAPFSYNGKPKPLWYAENASRFARWQHKIVHLIYPGDPDANPWANEWGQRAFLTNGITGFDPDDLVLYGDVDEIPDPRNVACRPPLGKILGHRQRYAVGYFNRVIDERGWIGTRAVRLGDIALFGTMADVRRGESTALDQVAGGWHFSSLGGADVYRVKVHSYAHTELDVPYYTDDRRLACEFSLPHMARWVPLEDDAPALFREPRWEKYVWPRPPDVAPAFARELEHAHGCFAYVPDDAPAVAVWSTSPAAWAQAGGERYGAAFAGAFASFDLAAGALARGGWLVVDGLERLGAGALAALAARGLNVVVYLRNSRSYDRFERLLQGEPFPPGRTMGLAEGRADIAAAGFVETRCDRIVTRGIFSPPDSYASGGRLDWFSPPVGLMRTSREELQAFLAHAFIFVLTP
jgi:beta-1,4-mannosyl-glycoprotein beta-1,4-N-acetylglucosaminyltransferase